MPGAAVLSGSVGISSHEWGMNKTGPGTLKCVIAAPSSAVLAALREHVTDENILPAGSAVLVYTPLEPSELRDLLARVSKDGDSLMVLEFEKWSGLGTAIDRDWLLARGH